MALNTPRTFGVQLTTSSQRIMHDVVPAGKVRHFTMVQCTSIDAVNEALVMVDWLDASNANTVNPLIHAVPVPVKDAIPAIVGAFSLEAGDDLVARASSNGDIHVTVVYYDEDAV